jgi:hypothetical protein
VRTAETASVVESGWADGCAAPDGVEVGVLAVQRLIELVDIDCGDEERLMADHVVLLVLGFVLTTVVGGVLG